jgi:hypothetical protein
MYKMAHVGKLFCELGFVVSKPLDSKLGDQAKQKYVSPFIVRIDIGERSAISALFGLGAT